jgi:hypothetical protein
MGSGSPAAQVFQEPDRSNRPRQGMALPHTSPKVSILGNLNYARKNQTFTSIFPIFSPCNTPINAFTVFPMPSTMSSRY